MSAIMTGTIVISSRLGFLKWALFSHSRLKIPSAGLTHHFELGRVPVYQHPRGSPPSVWGWAWSCRCSPPVISQEELGVGWRRAKATWTPSTSASAVTSSHLPRIMAAALLPPSAKWSFGQFLTQNYTGQYILEKKIQLNLVDTGEKTPESICPRLAIWYAPLWPYLTSRWRLKETMLLPNMIQSRLIWLKILSPLTCWSWWNGYNWPQARLFNHLKNNELKSEAHALFKDEGQSLPGDLSVLNYFWSTYSPWCRALGFSKYYKRPVALEKQVLTP